MNFLYTIHTYTQYIYMLYANCIYVPLSTYNRMLFVYNKYDRYIYMYVNRNCNFRI